MNNTIVKESTKIENLIYEIRGKQVMLDSDLAKLYECANGTKDINKAVNRNKERFPDDFYFQLTKEEYYEVLRFQFGTLELQQGNYSKFLPHVFTEQGVAMLSSVLRTEIAAKTSVSIMRAFVAMKKYISNNIFEQGYINKLVLEHDENIKLIQETLTKLEEKTKINSIFSEGQIYDAFSLLINIFNEAKEEIIIIDNFANKELLDILKNIDRKIIIVSKNIGDELVKKYKAQYLNVDFVLNNSFHDRFIILDNKIL